MLTLLEQGSGGKKTGPALDTIEKFRDLQKGTKLFETKEQTEVLYFGICNDSCVFILSPQNSKMYLYYLKSENAYAYDAGQPKSVSMDFNRSLNGETLGLGNDYHVGILYSYRVIWNNPSERTAIGVLVTEVVEPLSQQGWFAQAPERKQQKYIAMGPDDTLRDFIGMSSAKSATSAFSTEIASDTPDSESLSPMSQGEMTLFQYFMYIDNNGKEQVIPNSGFLLTKKIQNGKLFVTRQGWSKGNITAGQADGKTYELTIRFS